jgi:hypothetical protein
LQVGVSATDRLCAPIARCSVSCAEPSVRLANTCAVDRSIRRRCQQLRRARMRLVVPLEAAEYSDASCVCVCARVWARACAGV